MRRRWAVNMLKWNARTLKCMKWAFCTLQTDLSSLARGLISLSNIKGKTAHNIKLFPWLTLIPAEFSAQQLTAILCPCVCVWMRAREHTRGPCGDPVHNQTARWVVNTQTVTVQLCNGVNLIFRKASVGEKKKGKEKAALWMMRGDSQKGTAKRLTHRLLGRFRSPEMNQAAVTHSRPLFVARNTYSMYVTAMQAEWGCAPFILLLWMHEGVQQVCGSASQSCDRCCSVALWL